MLAAPVVEWIDRAPEIAARIKEKLYVLDWPLAALRDLQNTLMPPAANTVKVEPSQISLLAPVVTAVTPAVAQVVIFAATLFFALVAPSGGAQQLSSLFASRDAKLRFLRIANDIEDNLASYVAVVTAINVTLGAVVAVGAWLFGFDNPLMLGLLTAILNYIPYIGPACMVIILTAVGLVTFPTLGYALLPPAAFVALTTDRRSHHHADDSRTQPDAQPAARVYRDRVLGVAVGADRRVPGGADVDRRFGDLQPSVSGRGSEASGMRWNFSACGPLAGQARFSIAIPE